MNLLAIKKNELDNEKEKINATTHRSWRACGLLKSTLGPKELSSPALLALMQNLGADPLVGVTEPAVGEVKEAKKRHRGAGRGE